MGDSTNQSSYCNRLDPRRSEDIYEDAKDLTKEVIMTWVDAFWAYVIGCMIGTVIVMIIFMLREE